MTNDIARDQRIKTQIISRRLREMIEHLRAGMQDFEDQQLKRQIGVAADMLDGLINKLNGTVKNNNATRYQADGFRTDESQSLD